MDSPASIFEKIDAALKVYSSAATLEGNPLSAPETSPAAPCTTTTITAAAPQKVSRTVTTKKVLGASRTLQSSSTKGKIGGCSKDPLRDAVPGRSCILRPACRDITTRRNIPAAPQQHKPPWVPDAGGALHTIKRGISIDGTSISPETTQRVTSASPDACPASETTQRDPRSLPDDRPAGRLDPNRPHQDKPASDTADAAGTPLLQGNEDTVYLQYPLTADMLIYPICSPPRSFHLLGGITRHLKRCHSKRVAFSCALCSLPFETQKQCKTHQVTCRKRLKGTTQSPARLPALLLSAGLLLLSLNKEKRLCKLPSRSLPPSSGQRNGVLRSRRYLLPRGTSPRSSPAGSPSHPLMSRSKSG
ncbi:unnamed protein product [Caretta caretta]